jgi:hypothetical protein
VKKKRIYNIITFPYVPLMQPETLCPMPECLSESTKREEEREGQMEERKKKVEKCIAFSKVRNGLLKTLKTD